jgi:phage terminase large subunit GpA-like protein
LTSEEVRACVVRSHPLRYWFKPSCKRSEALDRRVYALAALHARPVPWDVLLRTAPTEPPPSPSPPEEDVLPTTSILAPAFAGELLRAEAHTL